jgi:hypothetical protein
MFLYGGSDAPILNFVHQSWGPMPTKPGILRLTGQAGKQAKRSVLPGIGSRVSS